MSSSIEILIFAILAAALWYQYIHRQQVRRRSLPPGPRGWPVIGNMLDIPPEKVWLKHAQLAKQYGDMVYLEVFGQPMLILSSIRRAKDIFEKRSSNYSNRFYSVMLNEVIGTKWFLVTLPYGDLWRHRRRLLQSYFHLNMADTHRPIQSQAVSSLIDDLSLSPEKFSDHLKRYVGANILKTIYGYDLKGIDDDLATTAEEINCLISEVMKGGMYAVDLFPFLKYFPSWFPGTGFQALIPRSKYLMSKMYKDPYEYVKSRMASGTAVPCFLTKYLSELETKQDIVTKDEETVVIEAGGVAYAAGVDTTWYSLCAFVLAMVLHPEVQKKAQTELDLVTGGKRCPTFEDEKDLPYIQCILSETMRWIPVFPLGVPHTSIAEDVYEGYRIPAGTIVIGNAWAILQDETIYPEPEKFNPDRFLAVDGRTPPQDPFDIIFGFGRRICPGRHFARDTVWIAIVNILSEFSIEKALDDDGREIIPEVECTAGVISTPKPFRCRFVPRSTSSRM